MMYPHRLYSVGGSFVYRVISHNYHCGDQRIRAADRYGICAGIALGMMLVGALGMNMVPKAYFRVVERFSVFAATGFNAVLGIHLYLMDSKR